MESGRSLALGSGEDHECLALRLPPPLIRRLERFAHDAQEAPEISFIEGTDQDGHTVYLLRVAGEATEFTCRQEMGPNLVEIYHLCQGEAAVPALEQVGFVKSKLLPRQQVTTSTRDNFSRITRDATQDMRSRRSVAIDSAAEPPEPAARPPPHRRSSPAQTQTWRLEASSHSPPAKRKRVEVDKRASEKAAKSAHQVISKASVRTAARDCVVVGGLPWESTRDQVHSFFGNLGVEVGEMYLFPAEPATWQSTGPRATALIELSDASSPTKALACHGREFSVDAAARPESSSHQSRGLGRASVQVAAYSAASSPARLLGLDAGTAAVARLRSNDLIAALGVPWPRERSARSSLAAVAKLFTQEHRRLIYNLLCDACCKNPKRGHDLRQAEETLSRFSSALVILASGPSSPQDRTDLATARRLVATALSAT
uniref:RRM domain-containing protein n=1 Tax=Rhizochromulina marina TaxID=1034831 RepID=A0A7S2WCR6_9STRA|mmetsp:Transcript_20815/g.60840  ORF Transcript_20815/g.60840 Transcript_20815/m.60840 type:complete len:430 (+) Transcript_20815:159-1448(+)